MYSNFISIDKPKHADQKQLEEIKGSLALQF